MENELKHQRVHIQHKYNWRDHTRTVWNIHVWDGQIYGRVRDAGRVWLCLLKADGRWTLLK